MQKGLERLHLKLAIDNFFWHMQTNICKLSNGGIMSVRENMECELA